MLCFIYKIWLSKALDDDSKLNSSVKKHLSHCSDCRDFLESNRRLTRRLIQDQPVSSEAFHRSMADGVMKRIEATSSQPIAIDREETLFDRTRPLIAVAALLMILLGSVLTINKQNPNPKNPGLDHVYQTCRAIITDDLMPAFALTPDSVKNSPNITYDPYAKEANALYADIKIAMNHLLDSIPLDLSEN